MNQSLEKLKLVADANLFNLSENPYPGRGIVVGLDETGQNLVQVYWIMGRSENSRNRVFKSEGGRLFTEAADPSKVKDPSLIIYNAMRETRYKDVLAHVVSNGAQTDAVADGFANGMGMSQVLSRFSYEPDVPNFTPRITAVCGWHNDASSVAMSMIRKSPWNAACDQLSYAINGFGPGFGLCFTTYSGDGDPLPAFQGEPYLVPLNGNMYQIALEYWKALNAENRVSLAVKFIPKEGDSSIVIKNKFVKA